MMTSSARAWLPPDWRYPTRVELATGHHLRPVRASDVDLHLRAVLESRERLWSIYGDAWGWPPEELSVQQDRIDLARREAATRRRQSFSYALFDLGETELLGCVHIDPPRRPDAGAEVSWWVVDWLVGGAIEQTLDCFVPAWIATAWPIAHPVNVGVRSHPESAFVRRPAGPQEPDQGSFPVDRQLLPLRLHDTESE